MLTIDTELKRLLSRAEVEPVIVVDIQTDSTPTNYYYCAASRPFNGYPCIVSKVTATTIDADIEDFSSSINGLSVTLIDEGPSNDGIFRDLLNVEYLKNKTLRIWLGTHETDIADFAPVWYGMIDDVIPSYGSIKLRCKTNELRNIALNNSYTIAIGNKHPRQYIGLALYFGYNQSWPGIDDEQYHPWYNWDERFFNVRGSEGIIQKDYAIDDLLSDMLLLLRAWFIYDETGEYRLVQYESTDSIVDTWYEADIADVEYEIVYKNAKNYIRIPTKQTSPSESDPAGDGYVYEDYTYTENDSTAGTDLGDTAGQFYSRFEKEVLHHDKACVLDAAMNSSQTTMDIIDSKAGYSMFSRNGGFNGFVNCDNADMIEPGGSYHLFDYTTDYIRFEFDDGVYSTDLYLSANPANMAGFRDDWYDRITSEFSETELYVKKGTGSDYSVYLAAGPIYHMVDTSTNAGTTIWCNNWRTLTSDSKAYLKVNAEVMTWTGSPSITGATAVSYYDDAGIAFNQGNEHKITDAIQATLPTVARAQDGTSAASHTIATQVTDITMTRLIANYYLDRFKYGCPIINLKTNLSKIDVQVLDFVSVELKDIHWKDIDGITGGDIASYKWQVISKSFDLYSAKPCIKWKLAYVA